MSPIRIERLGAAGGVLSFSTGEFRGALVSGRDWRAVVIILG